MLKPSISAVALFCRRMVSIFLRAPFNFCPGQALSKPVFTFAKTATINSPYIPLHSLWNLRPLSGKHTYLRILWPSNCLTISYGSLMYHWFCRSLDHTGICVLLFIILFYLCYLIIFSRNQAWFWFFFAWTLAYWAWNLRMSPLRIWSKKFCIVRVLQKVRMCHISI